MRTYVIHLMGAVISASVICGIFPKDGEGKWVRFAAGLAVACAVLSPVFSGGSLPELEFDVQEISLSGNPYLMDAFEENLSGKIAAHLQEKTGEQVQVTVFAETDEAGNITGVSGVQLAPYTKQAAAYTAEFLEIDISRVVEE